MTAAKQTKNLSLMRVLAAALTVSVATGSDFSMSTMNGIGYKDTSSLTGLRYLSLAGGAPILVTGLNFGNQASYNNFKMEPSWIEGAMMYGPDLTEDDQMNSNDMSGRLGYITPSAKALMGVDSYERFNGEYLPNGYAHPDDGMNYLNYTLIIQNNDQGWDVKCPNSANCYYAYSRDHTPYLLDVTPPNLCQGQELHFHINPHNAHTDTVTPTDEVPYRSLHIGQYLIDTEDLIEDEDRLTAWEHNTQYGIMTDGYAMNSTDPKVLFYNGLAMVMRSATHCNFANSECWTVRVHPRIKTVSHNTGFTTGGQSLRLTGVSFNGTNVEIWVDGVNCTIIEHDLDYMVCLTGETASASSIGYQPGQPGMTKIMSDEDYNEYLALASTFEVMNLNSSQPLSGWFTAPATGDYRFYISCDAACSLSFNNTVPYDAAAVSTTMPTVTQIAYLTEAGNWRNYHYQTDDGHFSAWYSLTGGAQYYISGTTSSQMSVGVEIRNTTDSVTYSTNEECTNTTTNTPYTETVCVNVTNSTDNTTVETCTDTTYDNYTTTTACENVTTSTYSLPYSSHPHATKSIHQIAYEQTQTYEEWSITITNPDDGTYKLNFVNTQSDPISFYTTNAIPANGAAWYVRWRANAFYSSVWGASTEVNRTAYDVNGVETSVDADTVSILYNVRVLKLINGYSTSAISATKVGDDSHGSGSATEATISITPPSRGIASSYPFNGTYALTCTDNTGVSYTSEDILFDATPTQIEYAIHRSMAFAIDSVEVISDNRYTYPANGISYLLHFHGLEYEVPLCSIAGSGDYPLSGASDMASNNTVIRTFGESLFFDTVPLEMLKTDAQTPQVLVTVDGMVALCLDLNCDFTYTTPNSTIETQALSDANILTLTGQNLPIELTDLIWFGPIGCARDNSSDVNTTVETCTDSDVTTTDSTTNVTTTSTVTTCTTSEVAHYYTSIQCTLNDTRVSGNWITEIITQYGVNPNTISTAINVPVNITGVSPATDVNYLGGDLMTISGDNFGYNASAISVVYADGTVCNVVTVNMTYFTCQNNRFTTGAATTQAMTVTINSLVDTTLSVSLISAVEQSTSLTPTSASPVLKSEITVNLASDYATTLNASDFTVMLYSYNDTTYSRELYVMSVNDTAKTLLVKFPGAVSGTYYMQISATQYGRVDSDNLILQVHGTVTSVSPTSGSKYGGNFVTITGENFGTVTTDNPVMIGGDYCYVQTTMATQITCRTNLFTTAKAADEQATFIVFLKTSEEAATPNGDDIIFTYITPTTTVDTLDVYFNESQGVHQLSLNGTNIDGTIQVVIDGYDQTLDHYNSTMAIFNLVNLNTYASTAVNIYTSEGIPEGAEIAHTVDVPPAIISMSPYAGSSGSTLIKVVGSGWGTSTTDLNLAIDGVTLCQTVTVTGFGTLDCLTVAQDFADGGVLSVVLNGTTSSSSYINTANGNFSQSVTIYASNVTASGTGVIFEGGNFPTSTDFVGHCLVNGVAADSVQVTNSSYATCSFGTTGVPAVSTNPSLYFQHQTDGYQLYAYLNSTVSFSKTQTVTSSTTSLECSFAGGCTYAIEADGLYGTLLDSANEVQVCGSTCALRDDLSSAQYAVCELPSLASTYSINNYKIIEADTLNATVISSTTSTVLYDDETIVDYEDANTQGCYFGMTFKENHVGVLDEAKIFINFLTDKTPYVNNLIFQASNDNWSTSTDLYTFGEEIHEGWNYIDYRDDSVTSPSYNSYRFYGSTTGSCRVTEFRLHGVEAIANEAATYACTPKLIMSGSEVAVSGALSDVTYTSSKTAKLTAIEPRFGSVLGGTEVTLVGENMYGNGAVTYVSFDDRTCTITYQNDTAIVCTTSDKPYVPDEPRVNITIEGFGIAATQQLVFRYVSLYTSTETWGGDIPPLEGESLAVPTGQHLLMDADATEQLEAVIVEGSMIFAPSTDANHLRTFDGNFIFMNNGYFEVGTEAFPYTSKIQFTMHAKKASPQFGIFGNKMIGCRFCNMEMHGIPKNVVWTYLSATAAAGATVITVEATPDWNVGDHIVIAGSGWWIEYNHEERYIAAIDGSTITLTEPLTFKHISETPTYNGIEMPMKCEVGLLTRNVKFRGDPEDSRKDIFGAHIMVHSPGDESSQARIHYIEITEAGQAFQLGRYAVHFHMIGTVHGSLIKGNAIHHSYNRAVTTHGVHYFKVEQNVAYDTLGHSFFVEDAVETKCVYDGNLSILTKAANSFLNTDQTPGAFWLTGPDNILINNNVVGTDAYGYWYDMQKTGIGANYDPNICPEFTKLGEFRNNTSHGNRKYGLRLFHALIPRTYPCSESPYDADYLANGQTDPYWQNPKIPAIFDGFVGWKIARNAAITERTGAVTFRNFRVADSGIAGIEVSMIEDISSDGLVQVEDTLIVGNTGLNDDDAVLAGSNVWGFIGPRWEHFLLNSTQFHNFNFGTSAAIGTCSHCFHPATTDSGSRTITTNNLTFVDTPKRILYQEPWREIIHDLDGSLTGMGTDSWATYFYPHLNHSNCVHDADVYDGLICDSTNKLRRIAFFGYTPWSITMQNIKVAQWDADIEANITSNDTYLYEFEQDVNHQYFSRLSQREKPNPSMGWPVVFATNHRYRFHWGEGIDFTKMKFNISPLIFGEGDGNIHMMTNFTDVRASINMTDVQGNQIANLTYNSSVAEADLVSGDNVIYNQTEVRQFQFVVNGKNSSERYQLKMTGYDCVFNCIAEVEEVELSDVEEYWSATSTWESGAVPVAGDRVEIPSGKNIIYDVEDSPILESLTVNGRLTFENNLLAPKNLTLNTKWIYVQAGELFIGDENTSFNGNATIVLHGETDEETTIFSNLVDPGNKGLFIVGTVHMYGQPRDQFTRLRETVLRGATSFTVYAGLDWVAGDRIAVLPTAMQRDHIDYRTIESYDATTGIVTVTDPLSFYHWGQSSSTGKDYNGVDMRGEVTLLSRNVRIMGEASNHWGGQIVITDNLEMSGTMRTGNLILDSVEIYNCSQWNTHASAIRFESATGGWSHIYNSAVHGALAQALFVSNSANVKVYNSHFIGSRAVGINVVSSNNITLDKLVVGDVAHREELEMQKMVDKEACVAICAYFNKKDSACYDIHMTNSIAFGCYYSGYVVPGNDCDDTTSTKFKNNVAHSNAGSGAFIFPDVTGSNHATCYEGSYFTAYKVQENGLATHFASQEIRMHHITSIDTRWGIQLQTAGETEKQLTVLEDSLIYGETEAEDCPGGKHDCWCMYKHGFMTFGGNHGGKQFMIDSSSPLPMHKVKSYGAWAADTFIKGVTFSNFYSNKTACGGPQNIFRLSKTQSDFIPGQNFDRCTFHNVADDAMAYIMDPPEKWNNVDDCVGFPCTAPSNVIMEFRNTKFTGNLKPKTRESDFQIISDTAGMSDSFKDCDFREAMNAWVCQNDYLGMLMFIGDDEDWEDRTVAPVFVTNEATGYSNKLNSQMDHVWDGFYTGQLHKSQFNAVIETDGDYEIEYSSTPFDLMRYELRATRGLIKIKVKYWAAGSFEVWADGKKVDANAFDKDLGAQGELSMYRGCGENRFVAVQNYLEFAMTPYCLIEVKPVDAILTNVRMDWTMDEFYENGGPTAFVDRVAAALGIHASQFKVVAVYTGSVVVDYEIQVDTDDSSTSSSAQLANIESSLNTLVSDPTAASSAFGAPVLSASVGETAVVEDPNYTPQAAIEITQEYNSEYSMDAPDAIYIEDEEEHHVLTLSDDGLQITMSEEARNSLIAIIVVAVLIGGWCFGCGTLVICIWKLNKAAKLTKEVRERHNKAQEAKKENAQDASESIIEVDQQFVLNDQIDLDIFSKKREFKYNEDNLGGKQNNGDAVNDTSRHSNLLNQSERKPMFPAIGKVIEVNREQKQLAVSQHNLD